MKICLNSVCQNPLTNKKSQRKYCSLSCSVEHPKREKIQSWLRGEWNGSRTNGELSSAVRNYLLQQADYKCSECGWDKINPATGNCPVEIDHIDGNSENNAPSNLKVICPNCHSLTPTYKGLNLTGRGSRAYRKKYNQFNIVGRKAADLSRVTCECGNSKSSTSSQCSSCWEVARESQLDYPPVEEMLEQVHKLGMSAYARVLGKSDNTVRKYLLTRGVDKNDLRKKHKAKIVFCSSCQVQLTEEEVGNKWTRCTKHHVTTYEYPPLEDIITGVKTMGHTKYAASIGIKYGSTVRQYLANRGIVIK